MLPMEAYGVVSLGKLWVKIAMGISDLDNTDETRITLRRATYAFREKLRELADKVGFINPEAERAILRANTALFEAWTHLCEHTAEDDDHDH